MKVCREKGDDGNDRSFIIRDFTGVGEKKTGPSRFNEDFLTGLTKLSEFRIYDRAAVEKGR
jgi:hypothetical protein